MLKFINPTGSLRDVVRGFLRSAGYNVPEPKRRGICGIVNGVEFHQLDRRSVPDFIATGEYDAGITGRDLLVASGVQGLTEVCALTFSRASDGPTRWVLVQRNGFKPEAGKEVLIGCELQHFGEEILRPANLPFRYRVVPIYGSEEPGTRVRIKGTDMVVVVTESGDSIRENDLEIFPGCENLFESTPVILARAFLEPDKEEQLSWLSDALLSVLGANEKKMVKCNLPTSVSISDLGLPFGVAPTIMPLPKNGWCACEICIPFSELGRVLVTLKKAGAKDRVVLPIQGYLA